MYEHAHRISRKLPKNTPFKNPSYISYIVNDNTIFEGYF